MSTRQFNDHIYLYMDLHHLIRPVDKGYSFLGTTCQHDLGSAFYQSQFGMYLFVHLFGSIFLSFLHISSSGTHHRNISHLTIII